MIARCKEERKKKKIGQKEKESIKRRREGLRRKGNKKTKITTKKQVEVRK